MGGRSPGSMYFSVQLRADEKSILDSAAKAAGLNRNAFIRAIIARLAQGWTPNTPERPA